MSGQWRPLPAALEPEVAYLVGQLRELKDRSGLSLATLAARTPYSKSSWERYLNGTKLPPCQAVEALATLVGEPVDRLRALWEQAEARWSGRSSADPADATDPADVTGTTGPGAPADPAAGARAASRSGRWPALPVLVTAGCAGIVGLVVLAAALGIGRSQAPSAPGYSVGCHAAQCAGRDPQDMACGIDAASFAELRIGRTELELRISDECAAGWARAAHSRAGERIQVVNRDGGNETVVGTDAGGAAGYVTTPMVGIDGHGSVRACLASGDGARRCTGWGADQPVPAAPPGTAAAPEATVPSHRR